MNLNTRIDVTKSAQEMRLICTGSGFDNGGDNDQGRHDVDENIHRFGKGGVGGEIEKISAISLLNNYNDNKHSGITGADASMMMIKNVLEWL